MLLEARRGKGFRIALAGESGTRRTPHSLLIQFREKATVVVFPATSWTTSVF
jgi:hypothetical protein